MVDYRTTLLSLAARIEQEPPSRELDLRIHATRLPGLVTEGYILDLLRRDPEVAGQGVVVPRYTESLDAALALVRPGSFWSLLTGGERRDEYQASVTFPDQAVDQMALDYRVALTPAAAICAAALRAEAGDG